MLVLTIKQYDEIYDLLPDIDFMWSKMLIYELINEGRIDMAKRFFMNYYKNILDSPQFESTIDYFDRLFVIPDCQGILIKMFALCFQDFLVFLEKNLLNFLFKEGSKKITMKKSNRIIINSLIYNKKTKFSYLATELIIQQITLEIQTLVRKHELVNGLGLNQTYLIENSLLKPTVYNNIDTLGITNVFLDKIKNNINFEAGNTYDVLLNINTFKQTFFEYDNIDSKYAEISSDFTNNENIDEFKDDIEMKSVYSNNYKSPMWNQIVSDIFAKEKNSQTNSNYNADDFFKSNRFETNSYKSEESKINFFNESYNNSIYSKSNNNYNYINQTKIIIADTDTTLNSSKDSTFTNNTNFNDVKNISEIDNSIKQNISVKRNYNATYFLNDQIERSQFENYQLNDLYKKNLTNFQVINCKIHIEEVKNKNKSDFEIYSINSKKELKNDLESKLIIAKAINNFVPKYFKKENLNKKIIRLFYKYVKYLKSFITGAVSKENESFSDIFISKKLLPPFTTVIDSQKISFKSYNYKYIEWLFDDKLLFDLYEEFATNFSVNICDKMTYEYDLSFKEPFLIKKLSQYIRYLHYVSERNIKPQNDEIYSRISKRISLISGSFYHHLLNSLNSKYKSNKNQNLNHKITNNSSSFKDDNEDDLSLKESNSTNESNNAKKSIFKIEKVKRYITSI